MRSSFTRLTAARFSLLLLAAWSAASLGVAQETFYEVPLKQLRLVEGQWPNPSGVRWSGWKTQRAGAMSPRVVLDGEGEAFLDFPVAMWTTPKRFESIILAVRVPRRREVTGWLAVPTNDLSGMVRLRFSIAAGAGETDQRARKRFHEIKEDHFRRLLDRNAAGAAWFRARFREARLAGGKTPTAPATTWKGRRSLQDTFGLLSGSRAMSENLQLHRQLHLLPDDGRETVPLASLQGVTTDGMDWKALTAGLDPGLDPLARYVPHDQYAIFSPSFGDLLKGMDEFDDYGAELVQFLEPRAEDRRTGPWYRRQLCIEVTPLDRLLGDKLVASSVMTGSDPNLRTGTDTAVLFEPKDADALYKLLRGKQMAAKEAHAGVRDVEGKLAGIDYVGVRSSDRQICSYLFRLGDAVAVTNSLVQLQRLAETAAGKAKAVAGLEAYRFFRHRYPRGQETGFGIISADTMRRLASPRWRIGSSRRTRAVAILAELQAESLDDLVVGQVDPLGLEYPRRVGGLGRLSIHPDGVRSSVYGSMEFGTPVCELKIDQVTPAEAEGYKRWRDDYEKNWNLLGAIAVQFTVGEEQVTADVSVIPLSGGSMYQRFEQIARGAAMPATGGDPHPGTLLHAAMAVNMKSKLMRNADELASLWFGVKDAFSWVGSTASVYVDDDPVWKEYLQADDPLKFWEERGYQIPLAMYVDSTDQAKLRRIVATAQRVDNILTGRKIARETRRYRGVEYIRVRDNFLSSKTKQVFYYTAAPRALILAFREETLKKAIDRQLAADGQVAGKLPPRLGQHVNVHATALAIDLWQRVFSDNYRTVAQIRSWSNLPVLNAWKRRYPNHDPIALHRRFWNVTLTCPGGGEYRWNEDWLTMESTAFGHPGEPKNVDRRRGRLETIRTVDFGITFEHGGLRVKAVVRREK